MDYREFGIHDFLSDEQFIRWVTRPDAGLDRFWEEWLAQNPDRRPVVDKARAILGNIDLSEKWSETERREIWSYISRGMYPEAAGPSPRKRWLPQWSYIAAASVLLLFTVGYYWFFSPEKISTGYGETRNITLADGTGVTLNANSSLVYGKRFATGSVREVWIKGEAFFEVASRETQGRKVPFVVHTNQLDVEVLGTAFNVTNRRGRVDVALEHGSVKVVDAKNAENIMMLKPGEKATQLAGRAPIRKQAVDIAEYTGWTGKVTRYKGKSLLELAQMIKDVYDIEVIIESESLKKETFTGTFPSDSVSIFFEKLEKLYPVEVTRKGKRYYLR